MFARRVYMRLKPDSVAEFTRKLEAEIIPLLRKQNGFQDEITFVSRGVRKRLRSVCGPEPKTPKPTTAAPIRV